MSPRFGPDKTRKGAPDAGAAPVTPVPAEGDRSRDHLTGLLSSDELVDAVRAAVDAAAAGERVAFAYVSIDGLRELNAKSGNLVTDKIVRESSRRLKELLRASDGAGRITRDEFGIVMRGLQSRLEMLASLSKVRVALSEPIASGNGYFFPMVNYGTASPPADGSTLDALAGVAEKAMEAMREQTRAATREDAVRRVAHSREHLTAAQAHVVEAEQAVRDADNALAESKRQLAEAKATVQATIEYAKSLGLAVEPAPTGR